MFKRKTPKEKYQNKLDTLKKKYKKLIAKGSKGSLKKADKIMEEIKKMVKLGLRDGKITDISEEQSKKDSMVKPVPEEDNSNMQNEQKQSNPFDELTLQQRQQIQQQRQQQMQRQMQQPMPPPQQQYQQPPQQQYQQPPQQQYQQPPQQQYQQPTEVRVAITMVEGRVIPVIVLDTELENLLNQISEAMDNQSSIAIGNRVLNGRYIVEYEF